ncbi:MAG TPA: hypothetical protein VGS41_16740, partial [Chthonomonadales bacterium]|nr:hypothetical protein [Chthonomonadales bacterium]
FRAATENPDGFLVTVPEGDGNVQMLARAMQRLLARAADQPPPTLQVAPSKRVHLRARIAEILVRVRSAGRSGLCFDEVFSLPCARLDLVLSFLALLELVRLGRVRAIQKTQWGAIHIYPGKDRNE